MTINEKIYIIRINKGISQAELAYRTGFSIDDIKLFETNGTTISGYTLLKLLNAFKMKIKEFREL